MLYEYLLVNYVVNEVIIASDLAACGLNKSTIRRQLKQLTDQGKIRRYDKGIYYLPKRTIFNTEAQPSREEIIEKKYLKCNDECIGYITGLSLANQLGLTTQVPVVVEVVSNKASRDYREIKLANATIILRKPKVDVTADNYHALQFLDLMKDIDVLSELSKTALRQKLLSFMEQTKLSFTMLEPYIRYYPDKLFRNLYETGLLNYVSA